MRHKQVRAVRVVAFATTVIEEEWFRPVESEGARNDGGDWLGR